MPVMETYRIQIQVELCPRDVDLDVVMAVLAVIKRPLGEGFLVRQVAQGSASHADRARCGLLVIFGGIFGRGIPANQPAPFKSQLVNRLDVLKEFGPHTVGCLRGLGLSPQVQGSGNTLGFALRGVF